MRERKPQTFTLSANAVVSIANWYRAAGLEPGPLLLAPGQTAPPSKPKGRGRR